MNQAKRVTRECEACKGEGAIAIVWKASAEKPDEEGISGGMTCPECHGARFVERWVAVE